MQPLVALQHVHLYTQAQVWQESATRAHDVDRGGYASKLKYGNTCGRVSVCACVCAQVMAVEAEAQSMAALATPDSLESRFEMVSTSQWLQLQ